MKTKEQIQRAIKRIEKQQETLIYQDMPFTYNRNRTTLEVLNWVLK